MTKTVFGTMPGGEVVEKVVLKGGGLTASIITFGAVLQDLRLEGHDAPLVLGFEDLASYLDHSPYFGATPGRCANRIGDGRFSIDGVHYQLELNEKGLTPSSRRLGRDGASELDDFGPGIRLCRHGGRRPRWPGWISGNHRTMASFALKEGGVFAAVYETITDKPTIANVCHHAYFNLDGRSDILGHDLMIAADHYTPVDDRLIPTGEIRSVENTASISARCDRSGSSQEGQFGYDHNFCLSNDRTGKRSVALARSVNSGVAMEVLTTEPGIQFYAGVYLDVAVPGLEGAAMVPMPVFCLETQIWPDAVNHAGFQARFCDPARCFARKRIMCFQKTEVRWR